MNEVTLFRRFGNKEGLVSALIAVGSTRQDDPDLEDPRNLATTLRSGLFDDLHLHEPALLSLRVDHNVERLLGWDIEVQPAKTTKCR